MIEATCHCGAVRIAAAAAPEDVNDCNCSICRRLGTLWAYYETGDVNVSGATDTYRWGDEMIDFHRCRICGCTTHWANAHLGGPDRLGVNARLMAPEVLAAARVRKTDGASM
jgi:hypothetical protein